MVESVPQLWLRALYPPILSKINLNTCADPDCGNFGVSPDFEIPVFKGPNAQERRQAAATSVSALTTGLGKYTLNGDDKHTRVSKAFEYQAEPCAWDDGRDMICHHQKKNSTCEISFNVMSNKHFSDELDRLLTQNGLLAGPTCGHCGIRYIDCPEEFIFNGTHGKLKATSRREEKPSGFRIIHKPCKGKSGARISVSMDHQSQVVKRDNVRLLRNIVNGSGINDIRRLLTDPDTGKKIGVSRLYSRIFWLEKTLLAFERAKLKEWKSRQEKSGRFSHMRIAHDDVVISVNWESKIDRRLTQLWFTVSADIRSGYVFRIDANFDPQVDPAKFFEENYLDEDGAPNNIRKEYIRSSGERFTAPLLHFQRPSGRFDEPALFASAEGSWRVFSERLNKAYEDEIAHGFPLPTEVEEGLTHARQRRAVIDEIREGYFGFKDTNRDFRGSFQGMMVKPTYTKAAHLACLKEMMPKGKITLVGEQEAAMGRVVPHVFRDLIRDDLFEWIVISFDKKASNPINAVRIADFKDAFETFKDNRLSNSKEDIPNYKLLEMFCAQYLATKFGTDRFGGKYEFATENFQSLQYPQVWIQSPVQHYGETNKVIGFPVLRKKYRTKLKGLAFDQEVRDVELRAALSRRILKATIQPVSAFMGSLRGRTSHTERAGGKGSRNGPSYINGAVFNPAVLIAILNIYRIYYNWFELRQYVGTAAAGDGTAPVAKGVSSVRIPGSNDMIQVPKRRAKTPVLRTPAMRLGADLVPKDSKQPKTPDPRRVLYRPWLFHGTPLWRRFEVR